MSSARSFPCASCRQVAQASSCESQLHHRPRLCPFSFRSMKGRAYSLPAGLRLGNARSPARKKHQQGIGRKHSRAKRSSRVMAVPPRKASPLASTYQPRCFPLCAAGSATTRPAGTPARQIPAWRRPGRLCPPSFQPIKQPSTNTKMTLSMRPQANRPLTATASSGLCRRRQNRAAGDNSVLQ